MIVEKGHTAVGEPVEVGRQGGGIPKRADRRLEVIDRDE